MYGASAAAIAASSGARAIAQVSSSTAYSTSPTRSQPPAAIASLDLGPVRRLAANVAPSGIDERRRRPGVPGTALGKVTNRIEPFGGIGVDGRHLAATVGVLHDEVRRPGERAERLLVPVVADDAEQRSIERPRPAVTLGDQLVVEPKAQPRHIGVREKAVDAATGVVADVEHRVHPVRAEIECVPRLEPGAGRQRLRRHVDPVAAVIVEHDELVGAAGQEPLARRGDVRLEPWPSRRPVLGEAGEDLAHAAELRGAFHVHADCNDHLRPFLASDPVELFSDGSGDV